MAGKMREKEARRTFTPEQKITILKDIEGRSAIKRD